MLIWGRKVIKFRKVFDYEIIDVSIEDSRIFRGIENLHSIRVFCGRLQGYSHKQATFFYHKLDVRHS